MQYKYYALVHQAGSWDKHKLLDRSVLLSVTTYQLSWTQPLRYFPIKQVNCFKIHQFTRIQTNLTSLIYPDLSWTP